MPTLAYHERIPGHHLQQTVQEGLAHLPTFRQEGYYTAYIEGWARYAERLAWEMGLYEDDPYGDLGRLHISLSNATSVVVKTGIHAKG